MIPAGVAWLPPEPLPMDALPFEVLLQASWGSTVVLCQLGSRS
jgi:hypothetical protein